MSNDDPTLREEGGAYALGALSAAERAALEAEMARSAELAREVREHQEVAALLALAAPRVAPPASLRERILSDAAAVRPLHTAARDGEPSAAAARATRSRPLALVLPWLAAAGALLGVMWTSRQLQETRDARVMAERENAALRSQVASLDSVVTTLLAPDVQTVKLSATGAPPAARLYWNTRSNRVILAAFDLPRAPSGRTYQLWGIETGRNPVSLGTFNTGDDQSARASFEVPPGVQLAVGAVTEEPEGGSPQPTTQPFLVGSIGG